MAKKRENHGDIEKNMQKAREQERNEESIYNNMRCGKHMDNVRKT